MAHVTIEYMIMIPVLILQIFLFPLTASVIMDNWTNTQRTLELQDVAGHLGSTIQQLYYTINRIDESCSMNVNLDIPASISQYAYTVTMRNVTQVDTSYQVMNITLQFISGKGSCSTLVTLGKEVDWQENLSFNSTSAYNLSLLATKTGQTIQLTLGGA